LSFLLCSISSFVGTRSVVPILLTMEHPARRALLIAPALMFDSVIPNIYGNSVIILTCLDTVGKKPCEKRRKTRSFQCEKERKPGTFFNRTLRSR
jgi:hypothetical protein